MYGKRTSEYWECGTPKEKITSRGFQIISPFTDRRLEIFDLKTCRKAIVFQCVGFKKWQEVSSAKFYYKDNDASDYRIKEYFGFLGENVVQTFPLAQ